MLDNTESSSIVVATENNDPAGIRNKYNIIFLDVLGRRQTTDPNNIIAVITIGYTMNTFFKSCIRRRNNIIIMAIISIIIVISALKIIVINFIMFLDLQMKATHPFISMTIIPVNAVTAIDYECH
jgi:hypothetical protein